MKKLSLLRIVPALIAIQAGATASAFPAVTLLDGQHYISGQATYTWDDEFGFYSISDDYEDSSTYDPITGLRDLHDSASPETWTYAESWARPLALGVKASAPCGSADALAEGTWVFQPKWSTLQIDFGAHLYGTDPTFAELFDVTAQTQLYCWDSPYGPPIDALGGTGRVTFSVDPSHVYRLQASLYAGAQWDGAFHSTMEANVIPAPGALLLAAVGAGLVTRLRRHRSL